MPDILRFPSGDRGAESAIEDARLAASVVDTLQLTLPERALVDVLREVRTDVPWNGQAIEEELARRGVDTQAVAQTFAAEILRTHRVTTREALYSLCSTLALGEGNPLYAQVHAIVTGEER